MIQDISPKQTEIDFTHDSIVVKKFLNGILGGVVLDVTGYADSVVHAGQAVITNGSGYKPMPILGETYGAMPEGYKYCGVIYRTAKAKDAVSIMFRGIVNKHKAPYAFKSDFNVSGIILASDLDDTDPYANYTPIYDVSELPTGDEAKGKSIRLDATAINDYNAPQYFGNILAADAEVSKTIVLKAVEKVILDNVTIAGDKGSSNGKITFAAKELQLKNITAKENVTLYNAFEGYQRIDDPDYKGIEKVIADDMDINCPSLTHNIINVYTPADGAEIIVRNSKFNLTVDNTNVLRLANYMNAENVTVTFENVEWTYENGLSFNDWNLAGLVIYQPAASDVALNGDLTKVKTWRFNFINCKYNGEKVSSNSFGAHSQVVYLYNVANSRLVENPEEKGISLNFE